MQNGWRVGTLLGIPFFIHYSWFPIAAVITLSYSITFAEADPSLSPVYSILGGLLIALGLFSSVLAHELAHSLVALRQGIKVNSITLFVLGGMAAIDREAPSPRGAFWVAVAGPLLSLSLFLVLQTLSGWTTEEGALIRLGLGTLASINLALGVFNLLPGLPLDGGQILKALVWGWTGDRNKGMLWAARSGQALGIGMIALGVWTFLVGSFAGLWFGLLGFFILNTARNYSQYSQLQQTLSTLVAREVMTRQFRVVDLELSLREFVDRYLTDRLLSGEGSPTGASPERPEIYFAESDGRYKGCVRPERLRTLERSQWETLDLAAILQPMDQLPALQEEAPVSEVIDLMQQQDLKQVVVFTATGAVAGVIDKGDIVAGLARKMGFVAPPELLQRIREQNELPAGLGSNSFSISKESHSSTPD